MAQRAEAYRNVSEAIRLDKNGEKQVAFSKYLQSIQTLCEYTDNQCKALGNTRLVADVEETKQILSVIKECTERMNFILCSPETQEDDSTSDPPKYEEVFQDYTSSNNLNILRLNRNTPQENQEGPASVEVKKNVPATPRSLLSESMKKGNAQLFKMFQQRMDSAKDERTKINLKLELHRRLAENRMLTITKQAQIVRQQQKESRLALDGGDRAAPGVFPLSERELEKRKIFDYVLQYDASQVSPMQLKYFTSDSLNFESARKMFESTMLIRDHPITRWLVQIQTKLKFDIENALKEYSYLTDFLPDKISDSGNGLYPLTLLQSSKREVDIKRMDDESTHAALSSLSDCLEKMSSNIKMAIDDILEVFCLAYKSLLPEDPKTACYRSVEATLLQPLWPSLTLLFRMRNFPFERRIAETIISHLNSSPEEFGVSSDAYSNSNGVYSYAVHELRLLLTMPSLVDKISTLVQVSQKLCGENIEYENDSSADSKLLVLEPPYVYQLWSFIMNDILSISCNLSPCYMQHYSSPSQWQNPEACFRGADDLICILSYIIVQARIPQLVSECYALEQLMDQKYMLGEEGYSLTSFQTALKYLEMKKLMDAEGSPAVETDD